MDRERLAGLLRDEGGEGGGVEGHDAGRHVGWAVDVVSVSGWVNSHRLGLGLLPLMCVVQLKCLVSGLQRRW